ncbi:hypothetical protein VNO78_02888 [Psophocarpus tetragonolobus]|uniref:Uncharacterized protein n=1 Tax=Psophocarpus tetragonolobus TaxID=3891 RepID=A0AAN9TCW1_PSOTE
MVSPRFASSSQVMPKHNKKTELIKKSGDRRDGTIVAKVSKKSSPTIFITGIAIPVGSDRLYSGSTDGTVRIWDCHTGLCVSTINIGAEVTSLISERSWIFVGLKNAIKAWNTQTMSEFTLDGPKGQVLTMTVGNDILFAGSEAWDMDTLQWTMKLNEHTDVVTSLICWDQYLLSSSSDCAVKIWACIEVGTLNVIYTHNEENRASQYCFAHAKTIQFACMNCHHFQRGRLFVKKKVASIESGPVGLFFTGDKTGMEMVGITKVKCMGDGGGEREEEGRGTWKGGRGRETNGRFWTSE